MFFMLTHDSGSCSHIVQPSVISHGYSEEAKSKGEPGVLMIFADERRESTGVADPP